jgi:hypothetical protein
MQIARDARCDGHALPRHRLPFASSPRKTMHALVARSQPPGDLVYLSTRKLYGCCADLGLSTAELGPAIGFSGQLRAGFGAPSIGEVAASAEVTGSRSDPGWESRVIHRHLHGVVRRLGSLPSLDRGDRIREGEWFRFHRDLRFGVGHADADPAINALIVLDREAVPRGSALPALLMHGAVTHVLPPYASDALRTAAGSRSGSGTDELFVWLTRAGEVWEEDPERKLREVAARIGSAPRNTERANGMYELFANEDWLRPYLSEPVMRGAPCEGVAQASLVSITDERTLVMASPLFIRIKALESPDRRPKMLDRVLGRDG